MRTRTSSADTSSLGPRRHGLAEELGHRHALDRLGVLEGEEQARLGTDIGGPRRDVLAVEEDGA